MISGNHMWTAFSTIARREVSRVMRIWVQTILPSAITMSLYFVIFGTFIGSQVSDVNGYSYMQFIVPGLVMMAVITNSFSNVVSSFFGSKFQRSIEEILVSPTPNWIIIAGYVFGGVFRGIMVGTIVLIISAFFTKIKVYNFSIIVAFIVLASLLFSLAGFLNSIFAKKFDDVSIVPIFVLTPLTYLGGVFYSIDLLPPLWRAFSKANPILYIVNGFRYGFLGISDVNVTVAFSILIVFIVSLFTINLILMEKGIGLRK